jgi:zinc protease
MAAPTSRNRSLFSALLLALAVAVAGLLNHPAHAMKIQEITTPAGIRAWLVEERAVPLMAMRFAFDGGSAQNPAGKEGLANFITGMMDEGAAELDARAFQQRMEELAMRMSFEDGRDQIYGSFETLTQNRTEAIALLKRAINSPRFDTDAIERVRAQLLSALAAAARDPNRIASTRWAASVFPSHPYGRPSDGTPESVRAIAQADLKTYHARTFARDTLRVVVVGDIAAKDLVPLLDDVFGALPQKAELSPVPTAAPKAADKLQVVEFDVPQSVAVFGGPGLSFDDKDFMAAQVLNNILGGGGFSSRLMQEVREKRGLAYGTGTGLTALRRAAYFSGSVATKNDAVAQSLEVIRSEIRKIAKEGPTDLELKHSKDYLTGSFALRFDTNAKIANQLLFYFVEGFGLDYVERRNKEVEAVTIEDVRRVAKRLFDNDDFFVTVVGKPEGLARKGG